MLVGGTDWRASDAIKVSPPPSPPVMPHVTTVQQQQRTRPVTYALSGNNGGGPINYISSSAPLSTPRPLLHKHNMKQEWHSDKAQLLAAAGLQTRTKRTGGGYREVPYSADELLEVAASLGMQLRECLARNDELMRAAQESQSSIEDDAALRRELHSLHAAQREMEAELDRARDVQAEKDAELTASLKVHIEMEAELAAARKLHMEMQAEVEAVRKDETSELQKWQAELEGIKFTYAELEAELSASYEAQLTSLRHELANATAERESQLERIAQLERELRRTSTSEAQSAKELREAMAWQEELEEMRMSSASEVAQLVAQHSVDINTLSAEVEASEVLVEQMHVQSCAMRKIAEKALSQELKSRSLSSPVAGQSHHRDQDHEATGISARRGSCSSPLMRDLNKRTGIDGGAPATPSAMFGGLQSEGGASTASYSSSSASSSTTTTSSLAALRPRPSAAIPARMTSPLVAQAKAQLADSKQQQQHASSSPSHDAGAAQHKWSGLTGRIDVQLSTEMTNLQARVQADQSRYEQLKERMRARV